MGGHDARLLADAPLVWAAVALEPYIAAGCRVVRRDDPRFRDSVSTRSRRGLARPALAILVLYLRNRNVKSASNLPHIFNHLEMIS